MTEPSPTVPTPTVRITVNEDGPYSVSGGVPLRRRAQVESAQGEPLTWATTAEVDIDESYSLCRCGRSGNKPFCDGTHAKVGFDGTETAPTDTYAERAKTLPGTGVVLRDDESICEHAGFCATKTSNVWNMIGKTDDVETRSRLMAMVERCPSGRLTYEVPDAGGPVEPLLPQAIGIVDDGPLWVTGGVEVQRADGKPFETRNRMTLCRCGASGNKPLCDGSHAKIGWKDS